MAYDEYTRLGKKSTLRRPMVDETYDHAKEVNTWKRLKGRVRTSERPPHLYVQVPSCEPIRPTDHPLASHPLNGPSRLGENEVESRTTSGRKEENPISIDFTHNCPCREDGEDEDLRCLWIMSSDDEEDDEVRHTDTVSVVNWPRPT
jgi:hypothetical protein